MKEVRVIYWNILNDGWSHKHKTQDERLKGIASLLNDHSQKSPTIIFICEVEGGQTSNKISDMLGSKMEVLGSSAYPNDYMGFISNIDNLNFKEIKHKEMKIKWPKTLSVQASNEGVSINGIHSPRGIVSEARERISMIRSVLSSIDKHTPSIIAGDFNSLPIQPNRLLLKIKGYKLAKAAGPNNDSFPAQYYKGKNIPKWLPKLRIDATYYKGLTLTEHQSIETELSDHPILISDFTIKP